VFEYKVLIVQDISGLSGPHVTDIDGQTLYIVEDTDKGQREAYNYIPLHLALNQFGRENWTIDKTITGVMDGAVLILRREIKGVNIVK
jgi:hypothetical protein